MVDQYNDFILGTLDTQTATAFSKDSVQGQVSNDAKKAILAEILNYPPQLTQNMHHSLLLKVDGLYMIVHNLDTSDGLTNGVPCTVKQLSYP